MKRKRYTEEQIISILKELPHSSLGYLPPTLFAKQAA